MSLQIKLVEEASRNQPQEMEETTERGTRLQRKKTVLKNAITAGLFQFSESGTGKITMEFQRGNFKSINIDDE